MGFIGDAIGSITQPLLGKPDPEYQENATTASTNATNLAAQMASDYYGKTASMRNSVISRLSKFMNGSLDPTKSAMYAPIKMNAERQYTTARNELMEEAPRGGLLYDKLGDLLASKAQTLTDAIGGIVQDEYNKAYAMGQGSQTTASAGITNAANSSNGLLQALATQQQAGAQQASNTGAAMGALAELIAYLA